MNKLLLTLAATAVVTPLASFGQTIFQDSFGSSALNPSSYPSVTPTSTGYDVASGKNATATTIGSGHLTMQTGKTSSGITEAQALFSSSPVTLANANDYIRINYTFTDTTDVMNGNATDNTGLFIGLYYSGSSAPVSGLNNGGLSSGKTGATTGGVQNWLGFAGNLAYAISSTARPSSVYTRPAQDLGNNLNQELVYPGSSGFANKVTIGQNNGSAPTSALTVGNQYTVDLKLTYDGSGNLQVDSALYSGVGTGGSVLLSASGSVSGPDLLTLSFDGMAVGYRAGSTSGDINLDVNKITVTSNVAPVPEPSTLALVGLGMFGLVGAYRRQRRQS